MDLNISEKNLFAHYGIFIQRILITVISIRKYLYFQDQHSPAEGENFAGCPCHTSDYGCCEDGVTLAGGPDKEECQGCEVSAFGCCPDGFTPAQGEDMEGKS